jgi:hypothetical protein
VVPLYVLLSAQHHWHYAHSDDGRKTLTGDCLQLTSGEDVNPKIVAMEGTREKHSRWQSGTGCKWQLIRAGNSKRTRRDEDWEEVVANVELTLCRSVTLQRSAVLKQVGWWALYSTQFHCGRSLRYVLAGVWGNCIGFSGDEEQQVPGTTYIKDQSL